MELQVVGAFDVSVGHAQFVAAQFLEVGRLSVNEEFVDGRDLDVEDQAQVHPHSHFAKVVHSFFAADFLGSTEDAECSAHVVMQVLAAFVDQKLTSLALVIDESRYNLSDLGYQGNLGLTKRGLVADLIEVTHELRTFAEQAADCYVNLVESAKDLIDLFGGDQRRQMQHNANAQARSNIGWASGQVTETFVKRIG